MLISHQTLLRDIRNPMITGITNTVSMRCINISLKGNYSAFLIFRFTI